MSICYVDCRADGKLMLWDVRSAKGCLRTFDQHNGDTSAGPKSG